MYDTILMYLSAADAGGVSLLDDVPPLLEDVGLHDYESGTAVTGKIGGLSVSATERAVRVTGGSLCKWYLGNNYHTMSRGDVERAVEALSDALHQPMSKAVITRVDVGANMIMQHPVETYTSHLGALQYAQRLEEPTTLYYKQGSGRLCFYDKNKEQRAAGGKVPALYSGKSVLRYEKRHTCKVGRKLGFDKVTAATLSDERFYMLMLADWRDTYKAIEKIKDTNLDYKMIKSVTDFRRQGMLAVIEQQGGQLQVLEQIAEARQRGELSKKQAHDLRQAVRDVCNTTSPLTVPNEAVQELSDKIAEAVRFYR